MEVIVEGNLICEEGLRTLRGILPRERFKIKKHYWPSLVLVDIEGELIPCRFYSEDSFSRHCWKSGRPENLLSGSDTVVTCLKCQLDKEAEPRKFKENESLLDIGIILPELEKSEIKAKFAWYRNRETGEEEVKDEVSIPN